MCFRDFSESLEPSRRSIAADALALLPEESEEANGSGDRERSVFHEERDDPSSFPPTVPGSVSLLVIHGDFVLLVPVAPLSGSTKGGPR